MVSLSLYSDIIPLEVIDASVKNELIMRRTLWMPHGPSGSHGHHSES